MTRDAVIDVTSNYEQHQCLNLIKKESLLATDKLLLP